MPNIKGEVRLAQLTGWSYGPGFSSSSGAISLANNGDTNYAQDTSSSKTKAYKSFRFNSSNYSSTYKDGAEVKPNNFTIRIWKRIS